MMATRCAVALGDIFVDYIGDLSDTRYRDVLAGLTSSTNIFTPVDVSLGGAGLQFAVAARAAGFSSTAVIGKIGGRSGPSSVLLPDLPGELVLDFLCRNDVRPLLGLDPHQGTGRIMIVFLPGDRRLMLADRQANATLTPEDLTPEMLDTVASADLVHVSGYMLLQEGRREAVRVLARHAKAGKAQVALDLVPHDIYRHLSLADLCALFDGLIDWIIVEVPAAHQLAGLGRLETATTEVVEQLLRVFTAAFPAAALYVRPGHAYVSDRGRRYEHLSNYQSGKESRGQSAISQATLLYRSLGE